MQLAPRYTLWEVFFMQINIPMDLLISNMLSASVETLKIFFYTLVLSIPLGFIVALLRGSRFKIISIPIQIYQLIFRGTPLMLQLFFFMYGPYYIFGFSFDRFVACIMAFVIN